MEEVRWPDLLVRAVSTPGCYCLGLSDHSMIAFARAAPGAVGWVRLEEVTAAPAHCTREQRFSVSALEVPIREILWVGEVTLC